MLLINVHKLDIVFADAVCIGALENQVYDIGRVFSLEGEDVIRLRGAEHLCKGDEVNSQRDVAIAAVRGEAFSFEHHGDEGDMGVVHGLEGDSGVIAVKVAILDEVFDGINDL